MPNPPIHIDTKFDDRAVTLRYGSYLCVAHTDDSRVLGAYLTPLGARQLIDALEPLAAPRAAPTPLPALIGIEYITGPDPVPAAPWEVCYAGALRSSYHPGTYTTREAAEQALRASPGDCNQRLRSVRPVRNAG